MKAQDHPQYTEESEHLADSYEFISSEIQRLMDYNPSKTLNIKNQVNAEYDRKNRRLKELRSMNLDDPYFARIDWQTDTNDEPEKFYIGHVAEPSLRVYSWKDTMPGELYYTSETSREKGELLLKRAFEIDEQKLASIIDEYVHPRFQDTLLATGFSDTLLVRLLKQSRGKKLFDIVATIQREQYEIIRAPENQLLVVQGAAGSGKTSIALHRVAYLLYQHRNDAQFSPGSLLVLGPNPMFMRYIENVLPTLGERRVPQQTFDDWLVQRLDSPSEVRYEPQNVSLEILLDPATPRSTKVMRFRNAQHKGSLAMAQMLENYIDILYRDILEDREALSFRLIFRQPIVIERSIEELRQIFSQFEDDPFNQRREAVEKELSRDIVREIGDRGIRLENRHKTRIQAQIHAYFDDWRAQNVSVAYRRLLRTRPLLFEAGKDLFSPGDLELLAQDAPTALTPFRFSDLAALLYLKLLLDGPEEVAYSHIVIDEAQDITPLHLKVLREYGRGGMTILGDLAQGIYMHHGVNDWKALQKATGDTGLEIRHIPRSYRSTQEIIDYANRMLRRIGTPEERLAKPIARHGQEPALHKHESTRGLALDIIDIVTDVLDTELQTVGIVCKTLTGCKNLANALQNNKMPDYQLIDKSDFTYEGGVALIPSYLTKGLEFDVVILANADSGTYVPDKLDARLLFVVMTRASHMLHILWKGEITPYLDPNYESVSLPDPLDGALTPELTTIASYAQDNAKVDADWCVERLAGAGKLDLLRKGQIDEAVIDVVVRSFLEDHRAPERETTIEQLAPATVEKIERHVLDLATDPEEADQNNAITFLQLVYGLVRNTVKQVGLPALDAGATELPTQAVQLTTVHQAAERGEIGLTVSTRTTRRRALEAVDQTHHDQAVHYLDHLIDHGILTPQHNDWLQIPQAQIPRLIAFSLGYDVDSWEPDLIADLTHLDEPLSITDWIEAEAIDD